MLETLSNCPVCGNSSFQKHLDCVDYTVSQETFSLVKCDHCSFIFTNPRPTQSDIGRYYKSDAYISHTNSSRGIMNKVYQQARKHAIKHKLVDIVEAHGALPKTLLDYGSGTGEFLAAAKDAGWITNGLELDDEARALSISNYQLKVESPDKLSQFADNQFGVITLWHVLEHVHNLQDTIKEFKRILSPSGVLIIAVPNCESTDAQYYKEHWAAYDVPRHLYHFTVKSMKYLMENNGFSIEKTTRLLLDPYYISLLSEKYKNGSGNVLSAALLGLKTTLNGNSKTEDNSSLVYVWKK